MLRELLNAFVLVSICVVIHAGGIVIFARFLTRRFSPAELNTVTRQTLLLIVVFAMVISLHLVETGVWAMFYFWNNLFTDFETALYFSLGTYSTIGYGDVVLPQRWRLLGGIEGISGVLLCGLSGAFIFAVVNVLYQARLQQRPQPAKQA
jgi:ion channel